MPSKIEVKCNLCRHKTIGFVQQIKYDLINHLEEKHKKEYGISMDQTDNFYREQEELSEKYKMRNKMRWFNYFEVMEKQRKEIRGF